MKSYELIIVIVTYNGMQWINKCLKCCSRYSVVIVDNNSEDETVSFIKQNYPNVNVIEQSENLGFGAANNIGISYALQQNCDYVFLLNQDAYLEKETIEKLIEVHQENTEFGILSPIHLNGNGDKLDFNFSSYIISNHDILFDALKKRNLITIYNVQFVNAAAWLLPRDTLYNIGGFDPLFFHYGEDDNYCQRVLFHQYKIGIVPNCFIFHDREFRENEVILTNIQKLNLKERSLKNKWANINCKVEEDINRTKHRLQRIIFRLKLKLKFKKAKIYKNELNLIKTITPKIMESRARNKVVGTHYLKL